MTNRVSVVIPTTLRDELAGAIRSARSQVLAGDVEIIVVVDRPAAGPAPSTALDMADRIVYTGGGRGGAQARNIGLAHATGQYTAFLDDDDLWHPEKCARQVSAIANDELAVASCKVVQFHARGDSPPDVARPYPDSEYVPGSTISNGVRIEDFLFAHRRPNRRRASMFTSTLLMRTDLARRIPWASIARHQDWDYLIRLQRNAGARFVQLEQMLALIQVGSLNSVSATANWQASLAWCQSWREQWSPRTYVDFISAQPLRYALTARSAQGVYRCLGEMRRTRRPPSSGPLVIGIAGVLGRKTVDRMVRAPSTAN